MTKKDIASVCRGIVRQLLKEWLQTFRFEVEKEKDGDGHEYGCNGQTPESSFSLSKIRSMNRNWVEDEAIVRIDRQAVLGTCGGYLGQAAWDWFQQYVFADKKPAEARERMKFSRMRRCLQSQ